MRQARPSPGSDEEWRRFWSKVRKSEGCWEWQGYRKPGAFSYGIVSFRGKYPFRAHRAAFELTFGPIPEGMHVCHRCDNPPCCNPAHLFLGTNEDNRRDMTEKGRGRGRIGKGEENGFAKLKWDQVRIIRERYEHGGISMMRLAQEFGVSTGTIWNVVTGRYWQEAA